MDNPLKDILEALIFISVEPLSMDRIKEVLSDRTEEELRRAIEELSAEYLREGRGLRLQQVGGGFVLATRPEHDPWVRRLLQIERKTKLSHAAVETLSVVAYHQPVTQPEIQAIRGVDSSYTIKTLLEKKIVKICGRKKAPGSPLLYRTTDRFLAYFGLNDLSDLPSVEEVAKMLEEGDVPEEKRNGMREEKTVDRKKDDTKEEPQEDEQDENRDGS
ncbi:MAG: SMC-Scp complex subunit ScpB [Candidatus Aminicenantes bacterium]|nr:SMC-Scp complex subunit ScpB [Candidatus Aminicenantes bacterium]